MTVSALTWRQNAENEKIYFLFRPLLAVKPGNDMSAAQFFFLVLPLWSIWVMLREIRQELEKLNDKWPN